MEVGIGLDGHGHADGALEILQGLAALFKEIVPDRGVDLEGEAGARAVGGGPPMR
jgi:hypothetical protein